MFPFFQTRPDAHLKRVAELLRDANMARTEHLAAAEHHASLARMYSERASRLEAELFEAELGGTLPASLRGNTQHDQPRLIDANASMNVVGARPRLSSL